MINKQLSVLSILMILFLSTIAGALAVNAPVLNAIGDQTVTEDSTLTVAISGSDADNDTLSFSVVVGTSSFEVATDFTDNGDGSAVLSWTPVESDIGAHSFTITVSDGALSNSETFTVTVEEFVTEFELDLIDFEAEFDDYENDYERFYDDLRDGERDDDADDIDDAKDDLEDLKDDVEELQEDLADFEDDVNDEDDLDEDLEDQLDDDIEDLEDDLDELLEDIEKALNRGTNSNVPSTNGQSANVIQNVIPPPQVTVSEPVVEIETIAAPANPLPVNEGNGPAFDSIRTLVLLVSAVIVALAVLVFLLSLLFLKK